MSHEMKATLLTLYYATAAALTIWCVRSFLGVLSAEPLATWNLFNLFIK